MSGTGGGISIRTADNTLAMAPSGVQKERMRPEDMFVLDMKGNILVSPEARPPPYKPPKLSECSPLFMLVRLLLCVLQGFYSECNNIPACLGACHHPPFIPSALRHHGQLANDEQLQRLEHCCHVLTLLCSCAVDHCLSASQYVQLQHVIWLQAYEHRDAGAVMHSHSMNAVLATLLHPTSPVFSCTHLEMTKGIAGHGFYDNMVVPVIENTARECELTERMSAAMLAHPRSNAVLVRRHGVYVWGKTWIEAKTQAECYDYLFGIAVKMAGMGVDASAAPPPKPLTAPVATNGASPVATNGATPVTTNGVNGHDADAPSAKRSRANGPSAMTRDQRKSKFVVLDIEGTVAPIDFVHKTLFPYARKHMEAFLRSTIQEPATRRVAHALLKEINAPSAAAMEALVRSAGAGQAAPDGGSWLYVLCYCMSQDGAAVSIRI